MKNIINSVILLASILPHVACAQPPGKDSIEGIWKGTSLCQVKPSACHDENVIYRISRGSTEKIYTIQMNKIVNGTEEEMGPLDVVYDKVKKTLTGETKDRQGRAGIWLFRIDGKQMHGTLTINKNTLFRIIEAKKT